MCCFAGHVNEVSGTNIFARVSGDREYLVYEMTFSSDDETAMILPIPTASTREDAVEFVSLDRYPGFFRDLESHFKQVWSEVKLLTVGPQAALKVHVVGAFEASFVPQMDQFDRLDARFRIPQHIWDGLPAYRSFGFVVFKLRPGKQVSVHPMAFAFQTSNPKTLFFPTVHVHDGTFHEAASFDHVLYTQNEPRRPFAYPLARARQSPSERILPSERMFWMPGEVASHYLDIERTLGLVDAESPCFQASLVGTWPNSDVVVPI